MSKARLGPTARLQRPTRRVLCRFTIPRRVASYLLILHCRFALCSSRPPVLLPRPCPPLQPLDSWSGDRESDSSTVPRFFGSAFSRSREVPDTSNEANKVRKRPEPPLRAGHGDGRRHPRQACLGDGGPLYFGAGRGERGPSALAAGGGQAGPPSCQGRPRPMGAAGPRST